MKIITFRIDEEELDQVQKIAAADERTVGYVIRKAIKDYIKRHPSDTQVTQKQQKR